MDTVDPGLMELKTASRDYSDNSKSETNHLRNAESHHTQQRDMTTRWRMASNRDFWK